MRGFLVLVAAAGCVEPDQVRVVDGFAGSEWRLADVPRGGLDDLDTVSGPGVAVRYGTAIDGDAAVRDLPRDRAKDADQFVGESLEPRASWAVSGGVAVPLDLETLAMFSAFVHAEVSLHHYRDLGVVDEAVAPLTIHYLAEVAGGPDSGVPVTDNAFYFLPGDTVVIVPPVFLADIPLSMNLGVLAHELAHRVAYWEMWDAKRLRITAQEQVTARQAASFWVLGTVDEGVADYFGAVISGEPDFLGGSIPVFNHDRDVSLPRVLDPSWVRGTDHLFIDGEIYNPYPMGSVLASALWRTGEIMGHDTVGVAILEAQRTLTPDVLDLSYDVGDFEVEVLRALGGVDRACQVFREAYAPISERFDDPCT